MSGCGIGVCRWKTVFVINGRRFTIIISVGLSYSPSTSVFMSAIVVVFICLYVSVILWLCLTLFLCLSLLLPHLLPRATICLTVYLCLSVFLFSFILSFFILS